MTANATKVRPSLVLQGAYDYAAAATYAGCSERQLRYYVTDGLISPVFHGTKPVFLREDLDAMLESLPREKRSAS